MPPPGDPALRASGFFVARTPLLPLEVLERWAASGGAASARAGLRALVDRPEVREALRLASPGLLESLPEWEARPQGERGQKTERALVSYVSRMSVRTTPFGLFAGCTVGRLHGGSTALSLVELARYRRRTRLDLEAVFKLVAALERDPEVRRRVRYVPSSSLHRRGGQLRYIESSWKEGRTTHQLNALEHDPYLETVLVRARSGATAEELARALVAKDAELALEDAEGFVAELLESRVLEGDLAPAQTGDEPLASLLRATEGTRWAAPVAEVARGLASLDASGLGQPKDAYASLEGTLGALPLELHRGRLWQVDLYKPATRAGLGPEVQAELARAVQLIERLGQGSSKLDGFRERFTERFGARRVPLLEVLEDPSLDLTPDGHPAAEPASLLTGLGLFNRPPLEVEASPRERWLERRIDAVLAAGGDELALEEADFEALGQSPRMQLPLAFALNATLLAEDASAVGAGRFQLALRGVDGPSGVNLLARFGRLEPELDEAMRAHVREEEALRPDALFAEVVHLPEPRHGNLLQRAVLRGAELPYLGRSGAPEEAQLSAEDLELGLAEGRLRLYSISRGREVIPRISSAYDFERPANLALYRLLGLLQWEEGAGGSAWRWGALERRAELPRVTSGRLVLAARRWRVEPAAGFTLEALAKLRGERRWPRWLALVEDEGSLPIDLDNPLSAQVLLHRLRQARPLVLEELLTRPGRGATAGPEGSFATELIVPFVNARKAEGGQPAPRARAPPPRLDPSASPGWLYVKLYVKDAEADGVLIERVRPWLRDALARGAADRWFFIRYADPGWHVRLRLHGASERLTPLLEGAFGGDCRIWKLEREGYAPETERYGGPEALPFAERIFQADSEAALTLVGSTSREDRWRAALVSADALMRDFGLGVPARLALSRSLAAGYRKELRVDAAVESQLSARFRKERPGLEAMLRAGGLEGRSAAIAPWVEELTRQGVAASTLPSFLHMSFNRLLRSHHRAQELVLYDFLERLYGSQLARGG